ncbi:hypothetical protein [Streptomyces boninensis]|uniref:hypothetical protein n=1 Tax=Streptomyces boninensis TaxID=2039455 RepID=UPI003B20FDDE
MRLRSRIMAIAVAAGALIAISAASPASAGGGSGQTLGAGDSRCTDQVQSDNGAHLTGFLTYGTGEWTIRRAAAAGGAETVVFRTPAGSLNGQQVPVDKVLPDPGAGDFRYRACLRVDRIVKHGFFSIANYRMSLASTSPTAVDDIGPDTATLSTSAQACGDQTFVEPGARVRLAGTSTGPAQWFIAVTGHTNNYEGNWEALLVNAADIDRTVTLDPEITAVTACVGGWQSTGKISVGFELSVV